MLCSESDLVEGLRMLDWNLSHLWWILALINVLQHYTQLRIFLKLYIKWHFFVFFFYLFILILIKMLGFFFFPFFYGSTGLRTASII